MVISKFRLLIVITATLIPFLSSCSGAGSADHSEARDPAGATLKEVIDSIGLDDPTETTDPVEADRLAKAYINYLMNSTRRNTNDPKTIKQGYTFIKQAQQIESIFGKGQHSISRGRTDQDEWFRWSTVVYFGSRYELSFHIKIKLSHQYDKVIRIIGEPEFHLLEASLISENLGASYDKDIPFGKDKWEAIVKSKGDFPSVLGIKLNRNELKNFDKFMQRVWYRDANPLPKILQVNSPDDDSK